MGLDYPNQVNVQEAKNNFSKLLARAHAGEEIVICMAGKPFAKLVAINRPAQRELGGLRDAFTEEEIKAIDRALAEPLSDEQLKLWYDLPIVQTLTLADREKPSQPEDEEE